MERERLFAGEERLMEIIWDHEPLSSGALVRHCQAELGWKKSTTYTMLKRLSEKGYAKNENAVVTSVVSREENQSAESIHLVERSFGGSLPGFLVAYLGGKTLTEQEAEELKALSDAHRGS